MTLHFNVEYFAHSLLTAPLYTPIIQNFATIAWTWWKMYHKNWNQKFLNAVYDCCSKQWTGNCIYTPWLQSILQWSLNFEEATAALPYNPLAVVATTWPPTTACQVSMCPQMVSLNIISLLLKINSSFITGSHETLASSVAPLNPVHLQWMELSGYLLISFSSQIFKLRHC